MTLGCQGSLPRLASFRRVSDGPVEKNLPLVGKSMIGAWLPAAENSVQFLGHSTLHLSNPRLRFLLDISGGRVTRCELELQGAAGLTIGFEAGTVTGGNVNLWKDLPFDVTIPIAGPVPFSVLIRQSTEIRTVFTASNSIIKDLGEYTFTGSCAWATTTARGGSALRRTSRSSRTR